MSEGDEFHRAAAELLKASKMTMILNSPKGARAMQQAVEQFVRVTTQRLEALEGEVDRLKGQGPAVPLV
jgi:hypothetical protein